MEMQEAPLDTSISRQWHILQIVHMGMEKVFCWQERLLTKRNASPLGDADDTSVCVFS